MNDFVKLSVKGEVTVFTDRVESTRHNDVQLEGRDVIASALTGGNPVSHVLFLYTSGTPSPIGASGKDLTVESFYEAVEDSPSTVGLLKVPVAGRSVSSDAASGTATASFVALTDAAYKVSGIAYADGVKVYALGLVQGNGDKLWAAADITAVTKAANAQVGVRWNTSISFSTED